MGHATRRRLSLGRSSLSRLVLGIETSCDDTGAAVVDETGEILGESLHSQKDVHLRLVVPYVTSGKVWCLIDELPTTRLKTSFGLF